MFVFVVMLCNVAEFSSRCCMRSKFDATTLRVIVDMTSIMWRGAKEDTRRSMLLSLRCINHNWQASSVSTTQLTHHVTIWRLGYNHHPYTMVNSAFHPRA